MEVFVYVVVGIIIGITVEKWCWKNSIQKEPEAGIVVNKIVYNVTKSNKQLKDF